MPASLVHAMPRIEQMISAPSSSGSPPSEMLPSPRSMDRHGPIEPKRGFRIRDKVPPAVDFGRKVKRRPAAVSLPLAAQ